MRKRDLNQKVFVPKGDLNPKVKVSEWDVDPGNNKIYRISRTYERELNRPYSSEEKENVESYAT